MTRTSMGLALVSALTIAACGGVADRPDATPAPPISNTTAPAAAPVSQPAGQSDTSSTATEGSTASPAATPAAAAGAVNPPHGQPGHSCAIPVGAPMSSLPAGGATSGPSVKTTPITIDPTVQPSGSTPQTIIAQPQASSPQSSSSQPSTPAASTPASSARLNPPHGQPGHRCDVNVGDPLPSM